jgi:hypothetical protein
VTASAPRERPTAAPPTPVGVEPRAPGARSDAREVAAGVSETLARLRLEVLVYADAPAERMAFINGRKYVEGQTIDGAIRVERITEEGVVVSGQGREFVLRPPQR